MSQADGAAVAGQSINLLHEWVQKQDTLISQLTTGVADLPGLSQTVDRCTGDLICMLCSVRTYIKRIGIV